MRLRNAVASQLRLRAGVAVLHHRSSKRPERADSGRIRARKYIREIAPENTGAFYWDMPVFVECLRQFFLRQILSTSR